VEETIGYEDLFSDEEWDAIRSGNLWQILEDSVPLDDSEAPRHTVAVLNPPGQYEGNEASYELECDVCDHVGSANTLELAQTLGRIHEALLATIIERRTTR
jgi:hypothetical protein